MYHTEHLELFERKLKANVYMRQMTKSKAITRDIYARVDKMKEIGWPPLIFGQLYPWKFPVLVLKGD